MASKARQIRPSDTKKLFALSRNQCAHPECSNNMVSDDGEAVFGQIAHITAASDDGPRFDPKMTDEQRRSFDNLVLLCAEHHKIIDDNEDKYGVDLIKQWKDDHEGGALADSKELSNAVNAVTQHAEKIYNVGVMHGDIVEGDKVEGDKTTISDSKNVNTGNVNTGGGDFRIGDG